MYDMMNKPYYDERRRRQRVEICMETERKIHILFFRGFHSKTQPDKRDKESKKKIEETEQRCYQISHIIVAV